MPPPCSKAAREVTPGWCASPPGTRLWPGWLTTSSQAMSSFTKTICPTTFHERSRFVSQPAVIFGGPSPEHDVSILTGLQATRALVQSGQEVEAIYWSKTGGFFSVDPGVEARDLAGGAPRGARELRLVAAPGGGFVTGKGGLLGKEKPLDLS